MKQGNHERKGETMKRDNDLVLIGIGEAGYGFREPTRDELEAYEASKGIEADGECQQQHDIADYEAELEEREEIAQELRLGLTIEPR